MTAQGMVSLVNAILPDHSHAEFFVWRRASPEVHSCHLIASPKNASTKRISKLVRKRERQFQMVLLLTQRLARVPAAKLPRKRRKRKRRMIRTSAPRRES